MELGDYPSLYTASDTAANKAKQKYYRLLGAQLTIFVLSFFAGELSSKGNPFFSRVSVFLLCTSLIVSWINRAQHYDKAWYESRAVAEAIKTLSWRYMMQAEPFASDQDSIAAPRSFVTELQQIRKTHPGAATDLTDFAASPTVVSPYMDQVRHADWQTRKQRYLQERLEPERLWYETNARSSSSQSERWLWLVIVLQVLALFFAVVKPFGVVKPFWHVSLLNPVSFLMMIASTITGWSQAKRYDEAAHSYASVAQALGDFQGMATIEGEDPVSFANFVAKVEQSIAKERTTWSIKKSLPVDLNPDGP